jgi:hypothetical protein
MPGFESWQPQQPREEGFVSASSDIDSDDEEQSLIAGPDNDDEEAGGEQQQQQQQQQQGSRRSRLKNGIKHKGRKLKERIDNSKAPMTILWGRDGWEKFVALGIMSTSLIFQFVGLFGKGWLKHCYSIAFQPNKLERCPSYHLWDVCRAKGSNGCLGYNAAIFLFTISIFATIAIVHALWAYLKVTIIVAQFLLLAKQYAAALLRKAHTFSC